MEETQEVSSTTELAEARQYFKHVADHAREEETDKGVKDTLKKFKEQALARNDQSEAKLIWIYEEILEIQKNYISAFHQMKNGSYYDAWCSLERVENNIHFLEPHYKPEFDEYKLQFIDKHTKQYQSLFPYKMFFSPALLVLEKLCSICQRPISIRNFCGHRIGEIYNGEMCCRIVKKAEPFEVSLVETPVQKYSVAFFNDPKTGQRGDHYNYTLVRYLIERLNGPFDTWNVQWTKKRQPHSRYKHVGRNESCPCGSGKKYKYCCLRESGILRPHCEFIFSVQPAEHLLTTEYID